MGRPRRRRSVGQAGVPDGFLGSMDTTDSIMTNGMHSGFGGGLSESTLFFDTSPDLLWEASSGGQSTLPDQQQRPPMPFQPRDDFSSLPPPISAAPSSTHAEQQRARQRAQPGSEQQADRQAEQQAEQQAQQHTCTHQQQPTPPQQQPQQPSRPNKCPCVVMVNQHFSMVDDSPESFRTIKLLQESTKSASKILNCSVCFDPTNATFGGLAKNVHLLGSLVSSIASLYATFMVYQKRRATETSKKNEPMKMFLGEDEASDALGLVPVTLSGQDYWNFLKAIMSTEFARLQDIGDAFADRQTQLHSQGHEACEGGSPCTRTEICSPVSMPIDACPTKVDDIKSQFSCFRTVEQVRQSIAQAQMTLHS